MWFLFKICLKFTPANHTLPGFNTVAAFYNPTFHSSYVAAPLSEYTSHCHAGSDSVAAHVVPMLQKYRDYWALFADNFLILQTITNLINSKKDF